MDLATVTRETFFPHLGTKFVMHLDPGELELELVEASAQPTRPNAPRGAFLLRFQTVEPRRAPQRIYRLDHPVLGTLEIFLVPAAPDAAGVFYDAVFS